MRTVSCNGYTTMTANASGLRCTMHVEHIIRARNALKSADASKRCGTLGREAWGRLRGVRACYPLAFVTLGGFIADQWRRHHNGRYPAVYPPTRPHSSAHARAHGAASRAGAATADRAILSSCARRGSRRSPHTPSHTHHKSTCSAHAPALPLYPGNAHFRAGPHTQELAMLRSWPLPSRNSAGLTK